MAWPGHREIQVNFKETAGFLKYIYGAVILYVCGFQSHSIRITMWKVAFIKVSCSDRQWQTTLILALGSLASSHTSTVMECCSSWSVFRVVCPFSTWKIIFKEFLRSTCVSFVRLLQLFSFTLWLTLWFMDHKTPSSKWLHTPLS